MDNTQTAGDKTDFENHRRIQCPRTIAWLIAVGRLTLSKAVTITVGDEAGAPTLLEAREIIPNFQLMVRRRATGDLSPWICDRSTGYQPWSKNSQQRRSKVSGESRTCRIRA